MRRLFIWRRKENESTIISVENPSINKINLYNPKELERCQTHIRKKKPKAKTKSKFFNGIINKNSESKEEFDHSHNIFNLNISLKKKKNCIKL